MNKNTNDASSISLVNLDHVTGGALTSRQQYWLERGDRDCQAKGKGSGACRFYEDLLDNKWEKYGIE